MAIYNFMKNVRNKTNKLFTRKPKSKSKSKPKSKSKSKLEVVSQKKNVTLNPRKIQIIENIQKSYKNRLERKLQQKDLIKKINLIRPWALYETEQIELANAIIAKNNAQLKNRTASDGSNIRMTRYYKEKLEDEIREAQYTLNKSNLFKYREELRNLEAQLAAIQ